MIEAFFVGWIAGIITVPFFLRLIWPKILDKLEDIIDNSKSKRRKK